MLSFLLKFAKGFGFPALLQNLKFISYADGKGHDCLGAVCTPLYGDPKMDCVPKYIVEPDCSIFAHLKVSSNGRTLSDEASVNGK